MFPPSLLSYFLCFHKIKTIIMWGVFFPSSWLEKQYIPFPCIAKCFGFRFLWVFCFVLFCFLSWSTFTIGIEQLCIDINNKFSKVVYNPIISASLKGVWRNGQTLENGLKLNKLKWELNSWINSLPLRHRISEDRLIGLQTRTFCFLHGVNPIMVTISIC